jgi:hypothetical protein
MLERIKSFVLQNYHYRHCNCKLLFFNLFNGLPVIRAAPLCLLAFSAFSKIELNANKRANNPAKKL